MVHTWTMGGCTVYIRITLLLLIRPFIISFCFLSNFQTLTIFVTLFSGTVRPTKLKLLYTHGQWVDVSCIPESACCCLLSLYFSFFFLSNFQTLNMFVTRFSGTVRPRRLKLGIHVKNGSMYRVYRNPAAALICPFFSFLSFQFSSIKNF